MDTPYISEHTIVPLDFDIDEAADEQRYLPAPGTERKRLSKQEKFQLAVWIIDGLSNLEMQELMRQRGTPVITDSAISRYRSNDELLEDARAYVRSTVRNVGLSETAIRVKRLQKHADRLAQIIMESGLWITEEKVIGWGKQSEKLVTKKFDSSLSKEYRETIRQIREEVAPLQVVATVNSTTTNIVLGLSVEDQQQIREALSWVPQVVPQIMGPVINAEVVEGEVVS